MASDLGTAKNGKAATRGGDGPAASRGRIVAASEAGCDGLTQTRGRNCAAPKRENGEWFAPGGRGGPGRPKHKPNQTTIDLRGIRDRIAPSWDRVDGDAILAQFARDDPREYLRLVVSLLPKAIAEAQTDRRPLVVAIDLDGV